MQSPWSMKGMVGLVLWSAGILNNAAYAQPGNSSSASLQGHLPITFTFCLRWAKHLFRTHFGLLYDIIGDTVLRCSVSLGFWYVGLSVISYVGLCTSIQPINIKQLPKYGFSERNQTNHAALVFVQALNSNSELWSCLSMLRTDNIWCSTVTKSWAVM